jgi:hypothetical protein
MLRALALLAGIALLVLAGLGLLFLPLGVRHCLDLVGPGTRVPCVQPEETLGTWWARSYPAVLPAAAGTLFILAAALEPAVARRLRARSDR